MNKSITKKQQQSILQLFYLSNDNRLNTIAHCINTSVTSVVYVIEKEVNKEIFLEDRR